MHPTEDSLQPQQSASFLLRYVNHFMDDSAIRDHEGYIHRLDGLVDDFG